MPTPLLAYPLVLLAIASAACLPPTDALADRASNSSEPLIVYAASDLRFALEEIAEVYEAQTDDSVSLVFGSTGQLSQQIEHGSPADLFFSANEAFVDRLIERGLLRADTRRVYAIGRLALVRAPSTSPEIRTLPDLLRPEVNRVAIANPEHAPYGMAARQALKSSELWHLLQPKLVLAENVAQAYQFVQTGNVDASIVALSLAAHSDNASDRAPGPRDPGPGRPYDLIDEHLYPPLRQAAAVAARSSQPNAARAFMDFVTGPPGRAVMESHGFLTSEG